MKIKISVPERYLLIQVIPEKGNFKTMTTIESLTKVLYPSEEELKEFEIEVKEDRIVWGKKALDQIELEFTDAQIELIVAELDKRSEANELNFNQFLLYKRFKDNG